MLRLGYDLGSLFLQFDSFSNPSVASTCSPGAKTQSKVEKPYLHRGFASGNFLVNHDLHNSVDDTVRAFQLDLDSIPQMGYLVKFTFWLGS